MSAATVRKPARVTPLKRPRPSAAVPNLEGTFDKVSQRAAQLAEGYDLLPLLTEAAGKLREHFPGEKLEFVTEFDPEIVGRELLTILVHTQLPTEIAWEAMEAFHAWWIPRSPRGERYILVTTERLLPDGDT